MTKLLGLIVIAMTTLITGLLMKNIDKKRTKYIIFIGPFVLSIILYMTVMLLTKDLPPHVCDGAGLIGILISFASFGMGIILNLINILYLVLRRE